MPKADWQSLAMEYWRELGYARALAKRLREQNVALGKPEELLLGELKAPDFDQGCIAYMLVNREAFEASIREDFRPGGLFDQMQSDSRIVKLPPDLAEFVSPSDERGQCQAAALNDSPSDQAGELAHLKAQAAALQQTIDDIAALVGYKPMMDNFEVMVRVRRALAGGPAFKA